MNKNFLCKRVIILVIALLISSCNSTYSSSENELKLLCSEEYNIPIAEYSSIELSAKLSLDKVSDNPQSGLFPVSEESVVISAPVSGFFNFFKGFSTHSKASGMYQAIDISAPLGREVIAYKSGVVTFIESRFHDYGCNDMGLMSRANSIEVLQQDGTMALYGHLMQGSVLIQKGDTVEEGQVIAKVGNSGYSKKPHLHFQVYGREGSDIGLVPIKFYTKENGNSWYPKNRQKVSNKTN